MQWQLSYCNIESNYVFIGSFIEINGWLISTKQTLISLASIGNFKCTAATLGISPVKLTRFVQCAEESCRSTQNLQWSKLAAGRYIS